MEISVILIPCILVFRSRRLQKETLQQIIDWEHKQDSGTSVDTGTTCVPTLDDTRAPSPPRSTGPMRSELYSMKALEKALTTNITPLLRFSALKDFSGENISFLKHIQDWKSNWTVCTQPSTSRNVLTKKCLNLQPFIEPTALRRHQFALAMEIYLSFISPHYSDFPINISCPQSKDLDSIFSHAASTLNAPTDIDTATPFASSPRLLWPNTPPMDDIEHHASSAALARQPGSIFGEKDTISIASTALTTTTTLTTLPLPTFSLLELKPRLSHDVAIPPSFGPHVFDDAERAVKYGVLTNTWPKFVAAGLGDREKEEEEKERVGRGKGEKHGGRGEGWRGGLGVGVGVVWCWGWVLRACGK